MSDCPETDEELWREHRESYPGAVATGEQTAWQARNLSAKSFVYVSNLYGIREFTYEEVRARYEKLPVIDCYDAGGRGADHARRSRPAGRARPAGS